MADNYDSIHIEYYYGTMVPKRVSYFLKNEKHNLRGPAVINYYESGNVKSHLYYINGVSHRRGRNPASIEYYEDGSIKSTRYFKYGAACSIGGNHYTVYQQGTNIPNIAVNKVISKPQNNDNSSN